MKFLVSFSFDMILSCFSASNGSIESAVVLTKPKWTSGVVWCEFCIPQDGTPGYKIFELFFFSAYHLVPHGISVKMNLTEVALMLVRPAYGKPGRLPGDFDFAYRS